MPAAGTGEAVKYVVQAGDQPLFIAAKYNTTVDAIVARNNLKDANSIPPARPSISWRATKISKPSSSGAPTPTPQPMNQPVTEPAPRPRHRRRHSGKWIDVNISTQTLTAYEGNTPVFSTLVSTGVACAPDRRRHVQDLRQIPGRRHDAAATGAEYYYLPAVPYTMYFYGGYAIHGTYWHHNFGHPMSHGCVNLPTDAAKWVFNWAPIGTTVVTHW